jgi:putative molybdopterin biosynthesis protein
VHKVELSYVLASGRAPEALIRNPLMDLLAAVRAQGSISGAARVLGQSYRHVGRLKQ